MIDTVGPGRVWGAGGAPSGPPDVTLTSTNTVVEDSNRSGNVDTGGSPAAGQTYYYRMTNPAHDECECGPGIGPILAVNDGGSHVIVDFAPIIYAGQGPDPCPTPSAPMISGYIAPGFAGVFTWTFTANYCNACGPVATDEQFVVDLWGPL